MCNTPRSSLGMRLNLLRRHIHHIVPFPNTASSKQKMADLDASTPRVFIARHGNYPTFSTTYKSKSLSQAKPSGPRTAATQVPRNSNSLLMA
jgi:hypothetical protein